MKIQIIGYSGSGKSTLAEWYSKEFNIPVLYFDTIRFLPNWGERTTDEINEITDKFLNEHDDWVIDGNYFHNYYGRRCCAADKIIFLNFSRFDCLKRAYQRYFKYKGKTRVSMTPGCDEKMDLSFINWILFGGRKKRQKDRYLWTKNNYKDKFIELHNQKELDEFIKKESTLK